MKKEYLEHLTLCELLDLMMKNTLELLDSIKNEPDRIDMDDMQSRLNLIHEVIRQKKIDSGGP